jgi:MFS family permease
VLQLVAAVSSLTFVLVTGFESLLGLGPAIFLTSSALSALPLGRAMDRFGRVPVIAAGFVVGSAGCAVTALATRLESSVAVIIGFALIGTASAAAFLSRTAAGDMYPPHRRARGISFVLFGAVFGAILGPSVFGPLFAGKDVELDALTVPWLAGAGLMLIAGAIVAAVRPDPKRIAELIAPAPVEGTTAPAAPLGEILRRPGVVPALIAALASFGVMVSVMNLTGYVVVDHHHHAQSSVFPIIGAHVVGMFGLVLFVGALIDRIGRTPALAGGLVVMAVSCAGLLGFESVWAGSGLAGTCRSSRRPRSSPTPAKRRNAGGCSDSRTCSRGCSARASRWSAGTPSIRWAWQPSRSEPPFWSRCRSSRSRVAAALPRSSPGKGRHRVLRHASALPSRIALCAAFVLLSAAGPAAAGSPGRWDVLVEGDGTPTVASEVGLARTGDGTLHVAWRHETGPLVGDIRVRSVSSAGQARPAATVVSGWGLTADPALVAAPGGLRVFFAAATPIEGLLSATAPAVGSPWSAPALVVNEAFSGERTPGVALAPDGTPLATWYSGGDVVVHRGVSPGSVHTLAPGGTNSRPNIVTDASGRVWVAWCRFQGGPLGVLVQQVDPGSGAPVGAAFQLPGSATEFQGTSHATCILESVVNRREPLVARVRGGVFVAGATGYPSQEQLVVWRIDGPGQVGSVVVARATGVQHSRPDLAADPEGRIWVAWIQQRGGVNRIVARRSNPAGTVFGAPVSTAPPGGFVNASMNLAAQSARLDVVGLITRPNSTNAVQHTQLLPGLSLRATPSTFRRGRRQTIVFRVEDAGVPVAGARVTVGRSRATTNAAGRATIVVTTARGARTLRAAATRAGYVGAGLTLRGR